MKKQADLLNKLREKPSFLFIILDACRYDTLNHLLDLDIEKVDSEAVNTQGWLKKHWVDHYDITYAAATPRVSVADMYKADDHFEKIIPVWKFGWDDDLETTPPEGVVKSVLENREDDKIIAHFIQPHAPHVGCDTIDFGSLGDVGVQDVCKNYERKEVLLSYLNNLKYVYRHGVEPLLDEFDDRAVVVSADHGEQLGDNGYYGHNYPLYENNIANDGLWVPVLRSVPWYEY